MKKGSRTTISFNHELNFNSSSETGVKIKHQQFCNLCLKTFFHFFQRKEVKSCILIIFHAGRASFPSMVFDIWKICWIKNQYWRAKLKSNYIFLMRKFTYLIVVKLTFFFALLLVRGKSPKDTSWFLLVVSDFYLFPGWWGYVPIHPLLVLCRYWTIGMWNRCCIFFTNTNRICFWFKWFFGQYPFALCGGKAVSSLASFFRDLAFLIVAAPLIPY